MAFLVCVAHLQKEGFDVEASNDAGTYLCNWIYFLSLYISQCQRSGQWHSLFVHMPPFACVPETVQMNFVGSLLDLLGEVIVRK